MNIKSMLCATAVAFTTINTAQAALIAHYDFDSSLTADASGNGNTLTNVNTTSTSGVYGNAASFNGLTSYLWADNFIPSNDFTHQTLSISFWYKANSASTADQPLVGVTASDGNAWGVTRNANLVGSNTDPVATDAVVTRPAGDTSGFQHIVLRNIWTIYQEQPFPFTQNIQERSLPELYINGQLAAAGTVPASLWNALSEDGQFVIGANQIGAGGATNFGGSSAYFDGVIDEVFVFDTAISTDDIQNLYTFNGIPNPGAPLLMGLGLAMLWRRHRNG